MPAIKNFVPFNRDDSWINSAYEPRRSGEEVFNENVDYSQLFDQFAQELKQQGYAGPANWTPIETGSGGEDRFGTPTFDPDARQWAKDNGYTTGYQGSSGDLGLFDKNGAAVARNNRISDTDFMRNALLMIAGAGVGAYAGAAGGASSGAADLAAADAGAGLIPAGEAGSATMAGGGTGVLEGGLIDSAGQAAAAEAAFDPAGFDGSSNPLDKPLPNEPGYNPGLASKAIDFLTNPKNFSNLMQGGSQAAGNSPFGGVPGDNGRAMAEALRKKGSMEQQGFNPSFIQP